MGLFDNAESVVINGKVVSSITMNDGGILYKKKEITVLSIDVPLNLVYSDSFNITGFLKTQDTDEGLSGETVKLKVGSTVVDSTTTDSTGAYSFTQTPVSMGNHSFQVIFEGGIFLNPSESSIVNRVIGKETSVIVNNTPTGKIGFASTGTDYNTVTPQCHLVTDDNEPIAGATLTIDGNTVTTQSDGLATGVSVTYPQSSVNIAYAGDSNYTASSLNVNLNYQIPTTITNGINHPFYNQSHIVVYPADQDGERIPNCVFNYRLERGATVIEESTIRTNSSGHILIPHSFTGGGDIDVTVSYNKGNISLEKSFVYYDSYSLVLSADKNGLNPADGDSAIITAQLFRNYGSSSSRCGGETLSYVIKHDSTTIDSGTKTTGGNGQITIPYTATGIGNVTIEVEYGNFVKESIKLYDGVPTGSFTGNSIRLGYYTGQWLGTVGDVVIDWGDGSTDTVNNPTTELIHTYTDGESSHNIAFIGEVTSLGDSCFSNTGLTSVSIPNSVTSLGEWCFHGCTSLTSVTIPNSVASLGYACFYGCTGLTSVVIPNSVTSLGERCFGECTGLTSVVIPDSVTSIGEDCFIVCSALVDYQLYWTGNDIITYDSSKMQNNTDTIFTIPSGETANYTAKGYPTTKLVERGETLTLTADKSIIQKTETSTITATLKQSGSPLTGKTLNYQVKHGSTVISSGTKTTNSSGQATISYTGTGVGDVSVIVSYGSLLQETYEVIDAKYYNDGSTTTGLTAQNGVIVTSDGEYVSITTSTSGEKYIQTPITVESSDNWECSCKVSTSGSGQLLAWNLLNENQFSLFNNIYFNVQLSMIYSRLHGGSGRTYNISLADNDTITLKRLNGHWILYHNDTQVFDAEYTWTGAKTIGYYTNINRNMVVKDIIIKAL